MSVKAYAMHELKKLALAMVVPAFVGLASYDSVPALYWTVLIVWNALCAVEIWPAMDRAFEQRQKGD